jgi:hypothetical protein
MGITIDIVAGNDKSSSHVNASGSVQHVISDQERGTFKLSDSQLKSAVKAYFGKSPNDAYVRSPTPWDDLYKRYHWDQVQMVLAVQRAEILEITSEPTIVKTQEFVNSSKTKSATFNVAISESVQDTVSSNWSTGGTLTVGQEFEYGVEFLGAGGKGKTSISYSQSWGIGGEHSKTVTVGSESGMSVELKPQEAVEARLSASRGVMKVRITYKAHLIGSTAINYNPTYKGHHFWALPIGAVMSAGNIANSNESTEVIEIGYYSNSKIELVDKSTGKLRAEHFLAATPGDDSSLEAQVVALHLDEAAAAD